MEPQCYVDGDLADWDTGDDDFAGCDVTALVVYLPKMTRRDFETWNDWLEYRAEARVTALLAAAAGRGGRLGVVDRDAEEVAEQAVEARFGQNFLEEFLNDTAKVALEGVGAAFRRTASTGVSVSPGAAREAISIVPAKSFRNEKALRGYLQEGKSNWRPSVRLSLCVSLDGRQEAVEWAAWDLRRSLSECGTITEWKQRGRQCSANGNVAMRTPRLVTG